MSASSQLKYHYSIHQSLQTTGNLLSELRYRKKYLKRRTTNSVRLSSLNPDGLRAGKKAPQLPDDSLGPKVPMFDPKQVEELENLAPVLMASSLILTHASRGPGRAHLQTPYPRD